MWQAFLISILQVWVSILEGFLASKKREPFWNNNHDDDYHHKNDSHNRNAGNGTSPEALLHKAYEVLELTPPFTNIGMDEVRKQWKKLSRRYHPDRNQGSEESNKKQQEVNEAMDRIQMALEGGSGVDPPDTTTRHDGDGSHEEEHKWHGDEHENFPMPPRPHPPPGQPRKQKSKKDQRREERYRRLQLEKERREFQQKIYAKMKKEMRKEREAYLAMMKEEMRIEKEQRHRVNQEIQKIQRETSRLGDLEQRQASSQLFMHQVERFRLRKQAQGEETGPSRGSSDDIFVEKPKNYIMESCANRIVVAMRLGMEELAVKILDDEINEFILDVKMQPDKYTKLLTTLAKGRGIVSDKQLLEEAIKVVIMTRLDEDSNSLLHYAVYWECHFMIRCVCDVAHHSGLLDEVFWAKNLHDNGPMELAWIARNPAIMTVLQSYETLVQLHRECTQLGPATVKAIKQLAMSLRTNFDLIAVGNTILAYHTGRIVVRLHWVWACLGVVALQCPHVIARVLFAAPGPATIEARLTPYVGYLVCTQLMWLGIRGLRYVVTHGVVWSLGLLSVPVYIHLCGRMKANGLWSFPLLIGSMLIYHPLFQIEESVFRPAWAKLPKPLRHRYDLLPTILMIISLLVRMGVILHWADDLDDHFS